MKKNLLKLTWILVAICFANVLNAQCPTITITPTSINLQCGVIPPTFVASTTPANNVTCKWLQPSGPILFGNSLKPGAPGVYTLSATNNIGGCTTTQTVAVTSASTIPTMTISAVSNNYSVTCVACVTMQISAMVQGGGGVGVRWMDASGTNTLSTSNTFSTCIPNNYMAYAYNLAAPNCSAAIVLSVISNTAPPVASFTSNVWGTNNPTLTCTNPCVILTGTSTAASYSVAWEIPAAIPDATLAVCSTTNVSQTTVATPTVRITDLNSGCIKKLPVPVYQNIVPPTLSVSSTPSMICIGQTGTLTASGSATNYTWSTGSNNASIVVTPTAATNYSVSNTNTANGCTKTTVMLVGSCLGLHQTGADNIKMVAYPNPSHGKFTIHLNNEMKNGELQIINCIGQTVFTSRVMEGNNAIDLSSLAKGLYHGVLVENKQAVNIVRLVIE